MSTQIACQDCGAISRPAGPSFYNYNPGDGPSEWFCEDHYRPGMRRPPDAPKSYEELEHEAAMFYADREEARRERDAAHALLAAARQALDAYGAAEWGGPEWDAAWDDLCRALGPSDD